MSSKVIQMSDRKGVKSKNKKIDNMDLDPRIELLQYIALMVQYWNGIDDDKLGQHERLVGLVMAILQALDGEGFELPQYDLTVKNEKENIAGSLAKVFPMVYEVVAGQVEAMKHEDED